MYSIGWHTVSAIAREAWRAERNSREVLIYGLLAAFSSVISEISIQLVLLISVTFPRFHIPPWLSFVIIFSTVITVGSFIKLAPVFRSAYNELATQKGFPSKKN